MKIAYFLLYILFISSVSFSQTEEQNKKDFSKKVRDADMLFSQGKFLDAKKAYEEAAMLNPNDSNVKKQIQICDANEQKKTGIEVDKEYNKLISKADEKFRAGDYQGAKDLFTRAAKFKTSDPYPPKMLKQIEDLLNPKPVIKAEPLPDLGQTSEMSIEEAQKALITAEIARKNEQNIEVLKKSDVFSKTENEINTNRTKEKESNNTNFEEVKNQIDSVNQENVKSKDSINIKLQHEDNSVISVLNFQQSYQRDLSGFVDRTIVNKTKLNDSITIKNQQIGSVNDTILFNKEVKNDAAATKENDKTQISRANVEQSITNVVTKEEKKIADNVVTKEEITELVNETNENIQDLQNKLIDKNKKYTNETMEHHLVFAEKEDVRESNLQKNSTTNNQLINSKDEKQIQIGDSISSAPISKRIIVQDSINKKRERFDFEDQVKNDSNRMEINNKVKATVTVVQTEIDDIENNQLKKRQEHEDKIVKIENSRINYEDSINKIENNAGKEIDVLVQKQVINSSDSQEAEVKELNASALKLTSLETETNKYVSQGVTKPNESHSSIENLQNRIDSSKDLDVEKRTVKALETKGIIENIEKKGVVFDEKAANSIGSQYPEGVTQEQFNKNDDKGSLIAVVTRRIVVKNGYGQIYTRTQTKDNITYSKNGNPSTEAIWQRETQDAKIKKN